MFNSLNFSNIQSKIRQFLKQPVVKNIILVASISLFIKGIGFVKESVVASTFGLSEQLDTYFIAMLIPGFISNVFLGSFKNVFIPNYISELKTGVNFKSFQATGFIIIVLVSLTFLLFSYLFTDVYLINIFPGHTEAYYDLVKVQFYYVAPCILLWGISTLISGLLNISNEFKYSSLNTAFIPITILACVLFFKDSLGDAVLAIGTLLGSLFNFFFLLYIGIRRDVLHLGVPDFRNANAILMFKQVPAKVSSGFLTGLIGVTDQYFAAQLAIGSIAALNYGHKIPAFITGLLILAMSNVLLPHFSKRVIENRKKAFDDLLKLLKWLFIASSAITIVAILMSDFVVELLFQRQQFTADDTLMVSAIQKIILIYAPFTVCGMVLVNFLTSINKNAFMAYVALISMVLNVILDFILMKFYGVYGIAICTTVIYIIRSLIYLRYTLKQKKLLNNTQ